MNKISFIRKGTNIPLRFLLTASVILSFSAIVSAQIAVKGETVWTMTGEPISNGVVLIKGSKIEAVGTEDQIKIPANYRVISAKVVTPGLIDARTVVGLNGYLGQPHDQMAIDRSASVQPELRAIDAYDARERLVTWLREFGVTTLHTGHQPSALISGQTMIVKTTGNTVEEAMVKPVAMVSVALGQSGMAQGRSPGTRSKAAAMLRAELIKAQESAKKDDPPNDLKGEIMYRVIKGEIPLLVYAEKSLDIMTALRIADEFKIKIILREPQMPHAPQ